MGKWENVLQIDFKYVVEATFVVYLPKPWKWSPMINILYFVSSTLSYNYHVFEEKLSFPGSLKKSILLFGFPPKEKKGSSIFATHVLHHWIVVFIRFWIGCVFHCLRTADKSKRSHKAPITASTFIFRNTSKTAFVSTVENMRWLCNCNQHCSNGNKLAN